jgi:hypothetical protein
MSLITSLLGTAGLLMLLIAFGLNSFGKMKRTDLSYNLLNCIGAFALVIYAFDLSATLFVVLESVWGIVAAYQIVKRKIAAH